MPLTRYGSSQILELYNSPSDFVRLASQMSASRSRGSNFCVAGSCPFTPGDFFAKPDLEHFLYYRARAITANIANLNGDLFPHSEILPSYTTFIKSHIFFNHDSLTPDKAFGIILDAVYTPVLFNNDAYADKYVEILGAIDRVAIREKRPGLLEDIESGRVTSTSMGTLASRAQCSVCGNIATDYSNLCQHMHPQSPMYCKGRKVDGALAYETNYGLTFIEDSIVYIPADPTAHMLEVYASRRSEPHMDHLADLFARYSLSAGRKIKQSPIELVSNFQQTGGLIMAAAEKKEEKPEMSPYQEVAGDVTENVEHAAEKMVDTKVDRIAVEELRKVFGPLLEQIDKLIRPEVKTRAEQELNKVKSEMGKVLPEVSKAQSGPVGVSKAEKPVAAPAAPAAAPAASAPAAEPAPAPAPAAPAPAPAPAPAKKSSRMVPIEFTEEFSQWPDQERQVFIQAVIDRKSWTFKGELEIPEEK